MTGEKFMMAVQDYYGQYTSRIMLQEIKRWLENCRLDLDLLWDDLIGHFSSQYGKVPDVSVLNDVVNGSERLKRSKQIYEDEDGQVWSHNRFIGHYDGGNFLPFYGLGVPKGVRELDHTSPEKYLVFYEKQSQLLIEEELKAEEKELLEIEKSDASVAPIKARPSSRNCTSAFTSPSGRVYSSLSAYMRKPR